MRFKNISQVRKMFASSKNVLEFKIKVLGIEKNVRNLEKNIHEFKIIYMIF